MEKNYKLDHEELEILNLFEAGKLEPIKNSTLEKSLAENIASAHLKKTARINIRLSEFDLSRIKRLAAQEGLPYQTLISSIIHKYASQA